MEFVLILFVFLLPLASLIMSMYALFHILTMKKTALKLAAMERLAGKDVHNG